ncbi:MAG: ABC transporter ATP-binding protein [Acidobacteria bacterium]|nr:MAG: ABC transporter ATP-binding protein [Acidobacteriota bacterium]
MATSRHTDFVLYRRLLGQVRPYWPHLTGILLLSLLSAPLALLNPLPLKIAVDSVIGTHPLPRFLERLLPEFATRTDAGRLALTAGLVVVIALSSQLRDFAASMLTAYTGEKLLRNFRAQLFGHVQRLSLSYQETRGTADSTYRIQYDAASVQQIAAEGMIPFVTSVFTVGALIYVTARMNWQLALVALSISPALYLVSQTYRSRLRSQSRAAKKIESSALSVVQEVLSAARVVKAFCQEDREVARFFRRCSEGMRARIRIASLEGAFGLLLALVTAVGMAAVLLIGVRSVRTGALTLGELLLVIGYLTQLYSPLKTMSKKMALMQSHLAGAERAFALLDESPDVTERPNARPLSRAKGAVAFRNVWFAYEKGPPVLSDISFQIRPGARVGIVGSTGAGKSTLVNLLPRFYDPTQGQILLDARDLREYKLADLRNQFAIVLQEPLLFSTSIGENIAYARAGAGKEEIMAAAKAANAHEFIIGLPKGYETQVGERGMRLSGGERQRISLARAFLKGAPVLILDEPTSSVDARTEAGIVEAMERLMRGRTTFIIAHRLSTLKHCDILIRIEHGRVLSAGPAGMVAEKVLAALDATTYGRKTSVEDRT